jgi:hypothetical protein
VRLRAPMGTVPAGVDGVDGRAGAPDTAPHRRHRLQYGEPVGFRCNGGGGSNGRRGTCPRARRLRSQQPPHRALGSFTLSWSLEALAAMATTCTRCSLRRSLLCGVGTSVSAFGRGGLSGRERWTHGGEATGDRRRHHRMTGCRSGIF